jgi:crotonobetainyl-CoA:carnitine CoA-transferase CaiB-like acyl-CoA transferase
MPAEMKAEKMNAGETKAVFGEVWQTLGGEPSALDQISFTGEGHGLPSAFKVGLAAQVTEGAAGLMAAEAWRARTGEAQTVSIDRDAAAIGFRSERHAHIVREEPEYIWDEISGHYRCGDGRWVQLHCNYPHHMAGATTAFKAQVSRAGMQRALDQMTAAEAEAILIEHALPGGMMRTQAEWRAHPAGQALDGAPLLTLDKIGGSAPRTWSANPARPLEGVKVLDMTRVIAGPVCGRTLAAFGAEVLRLTPPRYPDRGPLVLDGGAGKRNAMLNIRSKAGRETFEALVRDADIIVQGYRPGALDAAGVGADAVMQLNPSIVSVQLCAFGYQGPWAERRGFDSIVQTVSGIADAGGRAAGLADGAPKPLPAQALDHGSGYLMAAAALSALLRQRREGGAWRVRAALAWTGRWLEDLGPLDAISAPEPTDAEIAAHMLDEQGPFGHVRRIGMATVLSKTPPLWMLPAAPLDAHTAEWAA